MTDLSALAARVEAGIAAYDATMADCPVNNPKRGQVFRPRDKCPYCGSEASGMCGKAITAGWHLQQDIRAALRSRA